MTSWRRAVLAPIAIAWVLVHCSSTTDPPPLPCAALTAGGLAMPPYDWPEDTVFGFADLHAHPGIEKAFDDKLIWGTVFDEPRADANVLAQIESCPVETHKHAASSPLDRAVGGQFFPFIANVSGYAHGPVGEPSRAWPNARDVIHQGMSVSGIRRAYEGGLRLMFASTTHDQALATLFTRPDVNNGFVPSKNADFESAKKQFELIREIVRRNESWIGIATTPKEARDLIRAHKLALVLSLEMNGLQPQEEIELIEKHGVRHILPVHLIDNATGGTAASGDLFNLSSSAHSPIYRSDKADVRYMDISATTRYSRPNNWPLEVYTLDAGALYLRPDDVPYARYVDLCYEPFVSCVGTQPPARSSYMLLGEENARGLCSTLEECKAGILPGAARIQNLVAKNAIVDVTHMSRRSVRDTLDAIDPSKPIIASHGDVAHLCERTLDPATCEDDMQGPPNERPIEADYARKIVERHGVLGLGTGAGSFGARAVFSARGGPLLQLDKEHSSGCVAEKTEGCRDALSADGFDATKPVDSIEIATTGGIPSHVIGNAHAFVRIELRAKTTDEHWFQRRVILEPLACTTQGCSAKVALGGRDEILPSDATLDRTVPACFPLNCEFNTCGSSAYTLDDIQRVTLEWQYLQCDAACQREANDPKLALRQCRNTWNDDRAPRWAMESVTMGARFADGAPTPLASIAPIDVPVVVLDKNRGSFVAYDRDDRPSIGASVPASGKLLRVSMHSGSTLSGASPSQHGANVCVAVRQRVGVRCVSSAPPLDPSTTECTTGWTTINQRGTFAKGVSLTAFVRSNVSESAICGIDVAVRDWTESSFAIDGIRIDAIEDPVSRLVRRYAMLSKHIAKSQGGVFAWGSDFNGLNGLTDISEFPRPIDATTASVCPIDGVMPDAAARLSGMRIRLPNGTIGEEVRIDERGFATYGLFADLMAIVKEYPGCGPDVYRSLMLSAEATLRAWEWLADPGVAATRKPLPTFPFACDRTRVK